MQRTSLVRRDFLKALGAVTVVQSAKLPAQFTATASSDSNTLVKDGSTSNIIFVADNAAGPVMLATEELQRYVERMSGARLAVRAVSNMTLKGIAIGSDPASLPAAESPGGEDDAFRIKITARGVALSGTNPRSTLYAAYELLERLGCRWYFPGEDGEHVPAAKTLTLPLSDNVSAAAFASRGMVEDARPGTGEPVWDRRMTEDAALYLVWMARNRMNAYRNTSTLDNREFERRGVVTRWGSAHTIPRMLDKKLFATQPELFRMDQTGQRAPNGNVCVTNPETVRLCAQVAMDFFRQNPQARSFSVSGQDIWGGAWCACPKCRVYSPSEQNVVLINGIQEILRKNNVPGRCSYSAYRDTLRYDLKKVKLDPAVQVGYAPRERSYGHALSDASSERNRWFWRNLRDWRANHSGPLSVSDYYHDCILFYSAPAPTVQVIAQDLRDYHQLNARGVTSFMMGRYSWYAYGPSQYVFAKMAWDSSLDAGSLLDEMAQHQFGPAAASIRAFWRELELGMRPFLAQGEFETLPVTTDPFIEQAMLDCDEGVAHLDKAEAHVLRAMAEATAAPYASRAALQHGIYRLSRAGAEALRHTLHGNYWTAVAQRDDVYNLAGITKTNVRGLGYARERLTAARNEWQKLKEIAHQVDPEPGSYWVRGSRGGGVEIMSSQLIAILNSQIRGLEEIAKRSTT